MFSTTSQFEDEDDLVNNCLCKLQDGLKVKPGEATEALRQYGRFRAEMDRLQQRLERPSVGTPSVIQGPCQTFFIGTMFSCTTYKDIWDFTLG